MGEEHELLEAAERALERQRSYPPETVEQWASRMVPWLMFGPGDDKPTHRREPSPMSGDRKTQDAIEPREGMAERTSIEPVWEDPKCPKCGIVLANRMSYACPHSYCPAGLN